MVASHDHAPIVVSSLAVRSESGMHAFLVLDRVRTSGYVERGAQVPLPKFDRCRVARDLESLLSNFGLVVPIASIAHDLLLQSREEAWWRHLPVLLILPVGKIVGWH